MLNVEVEGKIGNLDIEVQFTIDSGSLTALFGPSGAGKTTIINMIAGLITPHHGNISVNGNTLFDSLRSINASPNQRRVGYVFQDNLLFPHLSVEGNLRYDRSCNQKPVVTPISERSLSYWESQIFCNANPVPFPGVNRSVLHWEEHY